MAPTRFGGLEADGALSESTNDGLGPGTAILRGFALEPETLLLDLWFA